MSQENVEIVRQIAELFSAGDPDRYWRFVSEVFAPDVEWRASAEDPDAATHYGREAYRRYVEQWQESFDGLRSDVEEYIDVGDDRVFVWVRWTGRGSASSLDVEWWLAIIWTVHNGKVVRGEEYFDRGEALEAVGLAK
jgi:ketosteroid isomerase-like protein